MCVCARTRACVCVTTTSACVCLCRYHFITLKCPVYAQCRECVKYLCGERGRDRRRESEREWEGGGGEGGTEREWRATGGGGGVRKHVIRYTSLFTRTALSIGGVLFHI